MSKIESLLSFEQYRKALDSERTKYTATVSVCGGTGLPRPRMRQGLTRLQVRDRAERPRHSVELKITGCHGFCEMGPLVVIWPQEIFYKQVSPEDVPLIVEHSLLAGRGGRGAALPRSLQRGEDHPGG